MNFFPLVIVGLLVFAAGLLGVMYAGGSQVFLWLFIIGFLTMGVGLLGASSQKTR